MSPEHAAVAKRLQAAELCPYCRMKYGHDGWCDLTWTDEERVAERDRLVASLEGEQP